MLSLIKKLFGQSTVRTKAPQSRTNQHFETNGQIQAVEVANLSLAAILDRLPEELKPLVLKKPEPTVTVALPIATIVKQLPSGAVKVSLATLHRQAPAGVLGPLPPGDKRMVEVPLAEVFRHIKPTVFKRRHDQRAATAFDSGFNLFGDEQNPYQIAPTVPDDEPEPSAPEPPPAPIARVPPRMAPPAVAAPTAPLQFKLARNPEPEPETQLEPEAEPEPPAPRAITPPPDFFEPKLQKLPEVEPPAVPIPVAAPPAAAAEPVRDLDSITLPLAPLSGGWPEPIRNELAALNGAARVILPKGEVSAGMARGKVIFTWGQIRTWLEPAPGAASGVDEATELTLPLKVVAPAFLASTKKPRVEQRAPEIDDEIPALFNSARAAAEVVAPATEDAASPEVSDAPESPEAAKAPEPAPAAETPLALAVEAAPAPVPAAEPEPAPAKAPETVGELFGVPEKTQWTPGELVSRIATLPGVAGAVVALQEGLLVAHSMPEDVKSEVIAAFLPQLFSRLNQYAGEMKLGEVDDLLFTTHGAHCQIYRIGYVYFAVLGKPGEQLPWIELRLVADELGRQTQKI
ncbi:MAG: roadblock/LC7 domain-containing protein [Chthoniobacteraceae bacterium]